MLYVSHLAEKLEASAGQPIGVQITEWLFSGTYKNDETVSIYILGLFESWGLNTLIFLYCYHGNQGKTFRILQVTIRFAQPVFTDFELNVCL